MCLQPGREVQKCRLWSTRWHQRREQTNNHAELLAVNPAMQVYDGNLEIRSDSEYVVRIATSRTRGETQKCNEGNADLWDEFGTELRLKATRRLDFVWVKRDATKLHIDWQITNTLNKGGTDAADALASATTAQHAAPQALTEAAITLPVSVLPTVVIPALAIMLEDVQEGIVQGPIFGLAVAQKSNETPSICLVGRQYGEGCCRKRSDGDASVSCQGGRPAPVTPSERSGRQTCLGHG